MTALAGREDFYVIVGGAAGSLIGLQFVAITIIARRPIRAGSGLMQVRHLPLQLSFTSAVFSCFQRFVSVPWHRVGNAAVRWGLLGLAGIVYEIIVPRRMQAKNVYRPQIEDWIFHFLLPLFAYAILAGWAVLGGYSSSPNSILEAAERRCCY
jgi:hypothetical protein